MLYVASNILASMWNNGYQLACMAFNFAVAQEVVRESSNILFNHQNFTFNLQSWKVFFYEVKCIWQTSPQPVIFSSDIRVCTAWCYVWFTLDCRLEQVIHLTLVLTGAMCFSAPGTSCPLEYKCFVWHLRRRLRHWLSILNRRFTFIPI